MKPYLIGLIVLISTLTVNRVMISMGLIYYGEIALILFGLVTSIIYINTSKVEVTSKDMMKASIVVYVGFVLLQFIASFATPFFSLPKAIFVSLISGLVSLIFVYIAFIIPLSFSKKFAKVTTPEEAPSEQ